MADDAFAATLDPLQAPPGDALAARQSNPVDEELRQNIAERRQLMGQQQRTFEQKEAAVAPVREQQIKQLRQPIPQPPQAQKLPEAPKRNDPGADEAWLSIAMVLGAIGGGLTRRHTTNALAAMTGALDGYNEGSRQKFDQNLKIWDAESKKILETNRAASDRYQQILANNKLALEQKMMEIQLTAAKFDDRATMQMAQQGQLDKIGDLIMKRGQFAEQMAQHEATLRLQHERFIAQERNADIRNERLAKGLEYRYDPAQIQARTAAAAEPKALGNTLSALEKQKAAITQYEATAKKNMATLIQLSNKVGNMGLTPLNRLEREGRRALGDNDVRQFLAQIEVVKPEVARIMSNPNLTGALTNYARQEASRLFDEGMTPKNVVAIVNLLQKDFANRASSLDAELDEVRGRLRGIAPPGLGPKGQNAPTETGGNLLDTVRSKLPQGWTAEPVQ